MVKDSRDDVEGDVRVPVPDFSRNTSLSSFLLVLSPVFLPHLQNLTFISGLTLLSSF